MAVVFVLSVLRSPASTARADDLDVVLHNKIEASTDNGVTWHNYSGSDGPGGETVSANPGDTIKVRVKAWDSGTIFTTATEGNFTVTNASYIDSISGIETNVDGDPISYQVTYFDPEGVSGSAIFDDQMIQEGDESGCAPGAGFPPCELGYFNLKLKSSFPAGETIITIKTEITGYDFLVTQKKSNRFALIPKAYAAGRQYTVNDVNSTIRISVNVAAAATTATTSTTTAQTLPQTGADTSILESYISPIF